MRKFEGLSDFFHNATKEEKKGFYLQVIDKDNELQRQIIEEAKLEEGTITQTTPINPQRPNPCGNTNEQDFR